MPDFLKTIPAKWLIIFISIGLISVVLVVGYSVLFQNKPVELWGIKVGGSTEDLRKQLRDIQAENESRVPSDKYNAVLAQLQKAESKISQQSSDVDNLKKPLKQRDDKPGQLMKQLEEKQPRWGQHGKSYNYRKKKIRNSWLN